MQRAAGMVWNPEKDVCEQTRMQNWDGAGFAAVGVLPGGHGDCVVDRAGAANRDILWFIPKSWRTSEPLYPDGRTGAAAESAAAWTPKILTLFRRSWRGTPSCRGSSGVVCRRLLMTQLIRDAL